MEFLSRRKKVFVWVIVIFCVIAMMLTVGLRYSPGLLNDIVGITVKGPQSFFANIKNWVTDRSTEVTDLNELTTLYDDLVEENNNLKMENNRLRLLEEENKRLTSLLGMSESYPDYAKVAANVVGKDPSNWYDTFIIDKGSKDGIEKNMVVLAADGLVGKVVEAGFNRSKVISIIDDTSSVSGVVTRNDSLGFVKGDSYLMREGYMRMEYFDIKAEVMPDDEITTSNLSEIYPKGLPIGYIKEITTDPAGLSKSAIVVPFVDFNDIKHVMVITQDFTSN